MKTLRAALAYGILPCLLPHSAAASSPLGNTVEADLVFPRDGGRYNASTDGIPIVVGLQNPAAASRYGYAVWWDLFREPRRFQHLGDRSGSLSPLSGRNTTADGQEFSVAFASSGYLQPGNYTLEWAFGVAPYCEFVREPHHNESTYMASHAVSRGSLKLVVDEDVPAPPALLGGSGGSGQQRDDCPSLLGVVSYASTTLWTHSATTVTLFDDDRPATYAATTEACVVTAAPTVTPGPCGVTVGAAVESGVYEMMGWPLPSRATSATAGGAPSATAGSAFPTESPSDRSGGSTRLPGRYLMLSYTVSGLLLIFT